MNRRCIHSTLRSLILTGLLLLLGSFVVPGEMTALQAARRGGSAA